MDRDATLAPKAGVCAILAMRVATAAHAVEVTELLGDAAALSGADAAAFASFVRDE